jgi:hypothetical protein
VVLFQEFLQGQEFIPDSPEQGIDLVCRRGEGGRVGRQVGLGPAVKLAPHGLQAQLLFFPEALDFKNELDVGGAVKAVAGAPAAGLEELPLLFPIAQHMGAHPGEVTYFTDGIEGLAGGVFFHAG